MRNKVNKALRILIRLIPVRRWRHNARRVVTNSMEMQVLKKIGLPLDNFISSQDALKKGYRELWRTWGGMGDELIFIAAAREYYKKTGIKPLFMAARKELFVGIDWCLVLSDAKSVDGRYQNEQFKISNATFHQIFLSANEYSIESNKKIKVKWANRHITQRIIESMGVSGECDVAPQLILAPDELEKGKLAHDKIAIMTGGMEEYKAFPLTLAQEIVNLLPEYEFIQIGADKAPSLDGVLNMQGRLTIRETAAILANARLFVGSIGGLLHLARAVSCPAVIAYSGEPETLVQYIGNMHVMSANPCNLCPENKIFPLIDLCPNEYRCIRYVRAIDMSDAIRRQLTNGVRATYGEHIPQMMKCTASPVAGMSELTLYKAVRTQKTSQKASN